MRMNKTETIRHRYNRIAPIYNLLDAVMEARMFKKERTALVQQASGAILEVGVGTGKNLPHYHKDADLYGIDFSPRMLAKAEHIARDLNTSVHLLEMDVQALAFADNSFDCVVTTCVFCSVPDPIKGLAEIHRVLKPGGQLLMLEHVRSDGAVKGKLMDWLNFIPVHLYGANINRRTLDNLHEAGFNRIESSNAWSDILKRIRAVKD